VQASESAIHSAVSIFMLLFSTVGVGEFIESL
jgi:hypothetical protein